MKLATLATLTALVVGHVAASPAELVLTPSGIPATSGLPFSTLSFDTTAIPSSVVSALSSLISSESTALMPYTSTDTSGYYTATPTSYSPSTSTATNTGVSPTTTSGARSLTLRPGDLRAASVGLVLGAVAAFIC